ncbi:MAG: hypothetical protein U0841_07200 [Chloroflexia bacterium]
MRRRHGSRILDANAIAAAPSPPSAATPLALLACGQQEFVAPQAR